MARSGHWTTLKHGADLAAQVGYRLGGVTPSKSLSREMQEAQVDYRLSDDAVDSRQVWFLGHGVTAMHLKYRPGERVTAADGRIVRDAMFGIDPVTGAQALVRSARNRQARIAAEPYASHLREVAADAGMDARDAWTGRNLAAQVRSLMAAAQSANTTVVFHTAEDLLRSNERAWQVHRSRERRGLTSLAPPFELDRDEVMRRLGAHHRRLDEGGEPQVFDGKRLDLSLSDADLGRVVWSLVKEQSELRTVTGNAGYEFTVTCPKSFSVAAFLADPNTREEWLAVVHDATSGASDELMRRVGHGRTGHSGDGQETAAIRGLGYAATVSIESYSRELDPHLHGHVMIPNRVVCADGKERTLATGGTDFINHAWWFQAEFERRLRRLSTDRGLVTGWQYAITTRQWEVAGANPDVMEFYSQGRARVQAETLDALAGEGKAVGRRRLQILDSRAKRTVTRAKDDTTLTWAQIRHRMRERAQARGIDLTTAFTAGNGWWWDDPGAWDEAEWAATIEEIVCENKGDAITARIEAAIRAVAPHRWSEQQITGMLKTVVGGAFTTGPTKARGRVGIRRHASNRVADAEARACVAFTDGFDANVHRLHADTAAEGLEAWRASSGWAAAGRDFTAGQRALFEQMTMGADRVSTVVGAAGSGKTTAVDAARTVLAAHGQRVYGVCVAAIAAQALRDTAKVEAGTVTWLTTRAQFANDPQFPPRAAADELAASRHPNDRAKAEVIRRAFALPIMDHLVIDEASMIPATDLATILEWTARESITVTLIGDNCQLQPVGPSGLFAQFHTSRPGAELTENLRQRTDVGRECAAFLRDGNPEQAFLRLAEAGQLVVVTSQTEAEQVLVDAWANRAATCTDSLERLASTGLESDRNDQVEILNTLARHAARERGWVTGDDVTYIDRGASRAVAVGDQILVTANMRKGLPRPLHNGTRALVTTTEPDGVRIAYTDDGTVREAYLSARQVVRSTRLGYAMTTHKLQGQTLDSLVIDVGPDRDMSSTYVAFTRHRDDVLAVVNIADLAEGDQVRALMNAGPDARRDAVLSMLAERITARGFADSGTAHDALATPLPLPARVTPAPVRSPRFGMGVA